jgi:hypothetical protein
VSEYDGEGSMMRRLWPTRGCCAVEKKKVDYEYLSIYIDVLPEMKYALFM